MKIPIKYTHKITLKSPYWLSNLISYLDVFNFCLDTTLILKALDKHFYVTWQFVKYQNLCFFTYIQSMDHNSSFLDVIGHEAI